MSHVAFGTHPGRLALTCFPSTLHDSVYPFIHDSVIPLLLKPVEVPSAAQNEAMLLYLNQNFTTSCCYLDVVATEVTGFGDSRCLVSCSGQAVWDQFWLGLFSGGHGHLSSNLNQLWAFLRRDGALTLIPELLQSPLVQNCSGAAEWSLS